jgi:hypothetical protein
VLPRGTRLAAAHLLALFLDVEIRERQSVELKRVLLAVLARLDGHASAFAWSGHGSSFVGVLFDAVDLTCGSDRSPQVAPLVMWLAMLACNRRRTQPSSKLLKRATEVSASYRPALPCCGRRSCS